MGQFVTPTVYCIGATAINSSELNRYLTDSGNLDFIASVTAAREEGISDGEILCSFYAKLCYASLTLGKNRNVSRIRDIPDNLRAAFDSGHSSVFEHAQLNFVARNCSRVYEAEQIRHRVGTAFSITSGRYVRTDALDMVSDPILQQYGILITDEMGSLHSSTEAWMLLMSKRIEELDAPFDLKKKLTSAARRWMPEGKAKEVGFSCNMRALRHMVMLRTSHHAEWEIRSIYAQVFELTRNKFPLLYYRARTRVVDDIPEVYGMKLQPHEKVEE